MKLKNILVAVILVMGIQAFFLPSVFARRERQPNYLLEFYHIPQSGPERIVINGTRVFSFPVSVSVEHLAAYRWIKNKVAEGILPRGLNLVYLDAHADFIFKDTGIYKSNNWVNGVLGEGLCKSAIWVPPEWLGDYPEYTEVLDEIASQIRSKYNLPIDIVKQIRDFPDGKDLGPIVLSIDCDFFSKMGDSKHRASRREIKDKIKVLIDTLKENNVQIAALNIAASPGYTYLDQQEFIIESLVEAFAKYQNE